MQWRWHWERRGLFVQDGGHDGDGGIPGEGAPSAQHFVKHQTERENIRAGVDGLRFGLLGRHVGGGAEDGAGLGEADGRRRTRPCSRTVRVAGQAQLGKPKIEQLDAGRRHQDIGGLQIAMRDAFGVRGRERIGDLHGMAQRDIEIQWTGEWRAFDELHDQVIRTDVVNLANVGMIQCCDGFGFALEALRELRRGDLRWRRRDPNAGPWHDTLLPCRPPRWGRGFRTARVSCRQTGS